MKSFVVLQNGRPHDDLFVVDGRAVVGTDGSTVVFNRRRRGGIDIMRMRVAPPGAT
jgi:hypothetical protein